MSLSHFLAFFYKASTFQKASTSNDEKNYTIEFLAKNYTICASFIGIGNFKKKNKPHPPKKIGSSVKWKVEVGDFKNRGFFLQLSLLYPFSKWNLQKKSKKKDSNLSLQITDLKSLQIFGFGFFCFFCKFHF